MAASQNSYSLLASGQSPMQVLTCGLSTTFESTSQKFNSSSDRAGRVQARRFLERARQAVLGAGDPTVEAVLLHLVLRGVHITVQFQNCLTRTCTTSHGENAVSKERTKSSLT